MPNVILIIEDSEPCATNLELVLFNFLTLKTVTARSACEALIILNSDTVSVRAVITDLHLPAVRAGMEAEIDGYELIARIRADSRYTGLPIIVTSGDTDPDNSVRLRRLGADAYFVKPYSPAAVRRTLERLLHVN